MKYFAPYEELIKFPNYSHLTREDYDKMIASSINSPKISVVESSNSEQDSLINFIFAPDPLTGVPRSDLAFSMSKDISPEVAQFIRDNLQRPIEMNERTENPDLAIDTIKSRSETLIEYADRIKEIVNKDSK